MAKQISLSPSKLNDFERCPRCFWDAYAGKVPKPRGIFPSLPGGMDLIMKDYVDQFRGKVPPGLEGLIPGVLQPNQEQMRKWRYWGTGPTYLDETNDIKLIGALDDCIVDGDVYIPLDWKTKGSCPEDDGSQYYQTQMDCYNLMLEFQGLTIRNEAHLVYIYPKQAVTHTKKNDEGVVTAQIGSLVTLFGMKPFRIECNKDRARELVIKAAECLRGFRPESSYKCEFCIYLTSEKALSKECEEKAKSK